MIMILNLFRSGDSAMLLLASLFMDHLQSALNFAMMINLADSSTMMPMTENASSLLQIVNLAQKASTKVSITTSTCSLLMTEKAREAVQPLTEAILLLC